MLLYDISEMEDGSYYVIKEEKTAHESTSSEKRKHEAEDDGVDFIR